MSMAPNDLAVDCSDGGRVTGVARKAWPRSTVITVAIVSGHFPVLSALRAHDPQAPPQVSPEALDAFAEADLDFRSLYAGGRAATLGQLDPLIVVEMDGEQQGLNLLATHQLDSELSQAFFGDPDRMEIDLLGNAASVYLDGFDLSR
jgi:hypothetical protein